MTTFVYSHRENGSEFARDAICRANRLHESRPSRQPRPVAPGSMPWHQALFWNRPKAAKKNLPNVGQRIQLLLGIIFVLLTVKGLPRLVNKWAASPDLSAIGFGRLAGELFAEGLFVFLALLLLIGARSEDSSHSSIHSSKIVAKWRLAASTWSVCAILFFYAWMTPMVVRLPGHMMMIWFAVAFGLLATGELAGLGASLGVFRGLRGKALANGLLGFVFNGAFLGLLIVLFRAQ